MACSGKNYDRRFRMDLPCGRIVMAKHEDGTEWCATHDPRSDFAKKNAAFAQRIRDGRRADAVARAAEVSSPVEETAPVASTSAVRLTHLTLPQLQRELSALLGDHATIPTSNRKLERRRY